MRVALLSDLAHGAILNFLQAPRSSLIGDPKFEKNNLPTDEDQTAPISTTGA
jgi:hypothetical protein